MTAETESEAEARAWDEVVRGWDDDARHRAYLDGLPDLEGLAVAGRRYREALEARPGDPVALRWRDEVIERATAAGLAQLPRESALAGPMPRWTRSAALLVAAAMLALVAATLVRTVLAWRGP